MSITDELRKWWVRKFPIMDKELHKDFTAIADRIDAEHERLCSRSRSNGYSDGFNDGFNDIESWVIDHEDAMAEHGWIRLPKDADGEPIHIGDVMEERSGHTFEVASLMAFGGSDNWLVLSDPRNFSSFREPHDIRHYHAPTVEDVLREMLYKAHIYDEREMELLPDLIADYAKRLTLAEGEDA